jgi:hypothetical protein
VRKGGREGKKEGRQGEERDKMMGTGWGQTGERRAKEEGQIFARQAYPKSYNR